MSNDLFKNDFIHLHESGIGAARLKALKTQLNKNKAKLVDDLSKLSKAEKSATIIINVDDDLPEERIKQFATTGIF